MISYKDAVRMAGHKLVAGFEGTTLPSSMIHLVREHKVSNVILFRRNVESRKQLRDLCENIQTLVQQETGAPALITIDQEGGAVSRLPQEYTVFPSQMAIAASGHPQNAYDAARMTSRQLLELGINFNLAPVMDLNINRNNPVIGSRSYGDLPKTAADFGAEAIRGYRESGVFAAAKHFPGHGDTAVDSHVGLPIVNKTLNEMWETELLSFAAAINAGVPAIMISHILYPKLQKDPLPATMSRDIVTGLLKGEMNFSGLAISDCMMMDAIMKYYGVVDGCVASAMAGMDLIFVSHSPDLAAKAAEGVRDMILSGSISESEFLRSEHKVLDTKRETLKANRSPVSAREIGTMRNKSFAIAREALSLWGTDILPDIGSNPLFIGSPLARAGYASDADAAYLSFPDQLSSATSGQAYVLHHKLSEEDISAICLAGKTSSAFILGVQENCLGQEEQTLLKKLCKQSKPIICVTLRTPYPLYQLPEGAIGLAAFDYSQDSLEVLSLAFTGLLKPSGKMPVQL